MGHVKYGKAGRHERRQGTCPPTETISRNKFEYDGESKVVGDRSNKHLRVMSPCGSAPITRMRWFLVMIFPYRAASVWYVDMIRFPWICSVHRQGENGE